MGHWKSRFSECREPGSTPAGAHIKVPLTPTAEQQSPGTSKGFFMVFVLLMSTICSFQQQSHPLICSQHFAPQGCSCVYTSRHFCPGTEGIDLPKEEPWGEHGGLAPSKGLVLAWRLLLVPVLQHKALTQPTEQEMSAGVHFKLLTVTQLEFGSECCRNFFWSPQYNFFLSWEGSSSVKAISLH